MLVRLLFYLAPIALTAGCVFDASGISSDLGDRDAPAPDTVTTDFTRDAPPDRGVTDADLRSDHIQADHAPPSDLSPDAAICPSSVDKWTLLLLDFNGISGTSVPDLAGNHAAKVVGTVQQVSGRPGCGKALRVPAVGPTGYVEVPDDKDWELTEGSFDFWVMFDTPMNGKTSRGIISRDANGAAKEGHIAVVRACSGGITVRLQRGGANYVRCSKPVKENVWYHVGINFGPKTGLQLFVNGQQANEKGGVKWIAPGQPCTYGLTCGSSTTGGIDGNDNPWVIGDSSQASQEGQATPLIAPLGGIIDHVRISSTTRSF